MPILRLAEIVGGDCTGKGIQMITAGVWFNVQRSAFLIRV
jgi:hypothetical protein